MTDPQNIQAQVAKIAEQRDVIVKLLDLPNLGTLRIDVNQALEEFDDLMQELNQTFPAAES
jgi:anion-transporting  ArsA/GET3 family ATPase